VLHAGEEFDLTPKALPLPVGRERSVKQDLDGDAPARSALDGLEYRSLAAVI
jgi:hypothetical protein